jgi:hypothetical protein
MAAQSNPVALAGADRASWNSAGMRNSQEYSVKLPSHQSIRFEQLRALHTDLAALAERYTGQSVQPDLLHMMAQVARSAARVGAA